MTVLVSLDSNGNVYHICANNRGKEVKNLVF